MNEELQTVNNELQVKVDEASRASSDMNNLLDSTDIATLFLDNDLNVRRFTPQATKIIKLIPADLGRPVTDLASELKYPELAEDAREILRTLAPAEKSIAARDGRWFTVRIMPYRTLDNRIDGVIITFADITVAKTLEAKLRDNQSILEKHLAGQSAKLEIAKDAMRAEIADRKRSEAGPGKTPTAG
jgi:two-component system CheB/CheR fusion protein